MAIIVKHRWTLWTWQFCRCWRVERGYYSLRVRRVKVWFWIEKLVLLQLLYVAFREIRAMSEDC